VLSPPPPAGAAANNPSLAHIPPPSPSLPPGSRWEGSGEQARGGRPSAGVGGEVHRVGRDGGDQVGAQPAEVPAVGPLTYIRASLSPSNPTSNSSTDWGIAGPCGSASLCSGRNPLD